MGRKPHNDFTDLALPAKLSANRSKGEQLREVLETLVGNLQPAALLPSERSLAERYGVARMTVRQQIDDLVARGLIRRSLGTGTFVAEPKLLQGTTMVSFTDDMRARGLTPGARLLRYEPANPARELLPRSSCSATRRSSN